MFIFMEISADTFSNVKIDSKDDDVMTKAIEEACKQLGLSFVDEQVIFLNRLSYCVTYIWFS